MFYVLFLKDGIAVAKSIRKSFDNIDLGVYDSYEEVTAKEYSGIVLPAQKSNGIWVRSNTFPHIEYPSTEQNIESESEPTGWEVVE